MLLAYFSALKDDPLYLFTQAPVEKCIIAVLERAWWPLLAYIEELYSYPIYLNGLNNMGITSSISRNEEVVIKAKNFDYGPPQVYPLMESRLYRIFNINKPVKPGVTTTL